MSYDVLAALSLFAFVSSITPGPNNLMVLASGANFGLRRTLPHMLGIAGGFIAMILLVGAGLAQVFVEVPGANIVLRIAATAYMLYLAWRIATAGPVGSQETASRPLTFLQAAGFQWVNPKAWAMALTATTIYLPENSATGLLLVAAVFAAINIPSVGTWTILGQQMARVLTNPRRLTLFNYTMAFLLLLSLVPVLSLSG